jgi:hypothetical protein
MSESDLDYEESQDEILDNDNHDTGEDYEDDAEADSEVKQVEEKKPKVSNFVDFDRDLNEQKEIVKSRLGEYHRVSMTTQRELDMVKAEKAALEAKLTEFSKQKAPEIPSIDLAIDNPREFERQQKEFLDYEANQRFIAEQQRTAKEREEAVKSQEINERSARILADAKEKGIDLIEIPAGMPPRACLGYSLTQLFFVLSFNGFIDNYYESDLEKAYQFLYVWKSALQNSFL